MYGSKERKVQDAALNLVKEAQFIFSTIDERDINSIDKLNRITELYSEALRILPPKYRTTYDFISKLLTAHIDFASTEIYRIQEMHSMFEEKEYSTA